MTVSRLPGHTQWAVVATACLATAIATPLVAQSPTPTSGGETTVFDDGPTAFGRALANLDPLRWSEVRAGKLRFASEWPARGPLTDALSCAGCHFRDGRGPRPDGKPDGHSHLLRLGTPRGEGDPIYGVQLRRIGHGIPAAGQFAVRWQEVSDRYPSGEPLSLRRPVVELRELSYGPIDRLTRWSLRVPPAVFGLGLLEAVADQDILSFADPDDRDGDGISGRAQLIHDAATGRAMLGRFGWKAAQPSLAAQSAAALANDLGIGTRLFTSTAKDGRLQHDASDTRLRESDLNALVQYLRALAVPARRRWNDVTIYRGEALFTRIGCSTCHLTRLTTGRIAAWPELANQVIHPYTDLLLHDMGEALADDVREGAASGSEWRTPPLWGLGLLPVVSGPAGLLHDGRARSPEEAILWHGGEAKRSRRQFADLPAEDRNALLKFLASL
jgi:CxxC motif-containing protein (DUF1111 family)